MRPDTKNAPCTKFLTLLVFDFHTSGEEARVDFSPAGGDKNVISTYRAAAPPPNKHAPKLLFDDGNDWIKAPPPGLSEIRRLFTDVPSFDRQPPETMTGDRDALRQSGEGRRG